MKMKDSDCETFYDELKMEFESQGLEFPWDMGFAKHSIFNHGLYIVKDSSARGELAPGSVHVLDHDGETVFGSLYVSSLQEFVSYIAYRLSLFGPLPENLHSRMALGNVNNHWVKSYFSRME